MLVQPDNLTSYRHSYVPVLISLLLLLPLLFGSPSSTAPFHLGLPRVHGGDEPHYLVMINSVILDGDLDLANNYAAIQRGAPQAGEEFSGSALVHHTVWFERGSRKEWWEIYENDAAMWDRDNEGHPVPRLRAGQSPPLEGHAEFSAHPPGVALLLAPILFPFRGTQLIEPLAICCSAIAIILAMFMFRSLIRKYNSNLVFVDLVTAVTFLGTPVWHYGRTLFNEPYLLLFAIASYSLALRGKNAVWAGIFIGLGMVMKPPFALLIIPLFLMYLVRRKFTSAALLVLPTLASLVAFLWLDAIMFGSPWRTAQEWEQGSFLRGAAGTLFSLEYGYLIIAPAIIVAIAAWPRFFRAYPNDAAVLMSGIALHFVFFACYAHWSGATCYAARYMVPILPLLFVSLASLPDAKFWQTQYIRPGVIAICTLSVVINGIAAIPYWKYWDSNPLYEALQLYSITAPVRSPDEGAKLSSNTRIDRHENLAVRFAVGGQTAENQLVFSSEQTDLGPGVYRLTLSLDANVCLENGISPIVLNVLYHRQRSIVKIEAVEPKSQAGCETGFLQFEFQNRGLGLTELNLYTRRVLFLPHAPVIKSLEGPG